MIKKVISGGQSGSDLAGWKAAARCGIPTGGTMPKHFLTEDGPRPEYASLYGATESWSSGYNIRTRQNVFDADVTIIFGNLNSPGSRCTYKAYLDKVGLISNIDQIQLGWIPIALRDSREVSESAYILSMMPHSVINIAGNRESSSPGIGFWVEQYLVELFTRLKGDNGLHKAD